MASATLFILPFKVAASEGKGAGAALGLLGFVIVLFAPLALVRVKKIPRETRFQSAALAWKIALAAAFGNIAQGYAFESLHPGVAATFIQLNVLFVALLSLAWLGEAPRRSTLLGVGLALSGVLVTQWPALSGHLDWSVGVLWAVGAAFGFSVMDVLARRDSHRVDSLVTNVLRSAGAVVLLSLVPGAIGQLTSMTEAQVGACALAALLGPGFARQLLISAARDLPAVESALLQQLRPLLALPLASVVFGAWPSRWEWWGCAFITIGVAAPYVFRGTRPAD